MAGFATSALLLSPPVSFGTAARAQTTQLQAPSGLSTTSRTVVHGLSKSLHGSRSASLGFSTFNKFINRTTISCNRRAVVRVSAGIFDKPGKGYPSQPATGYPSQPAQGYPYANSPPEPQPRGGGSGTYVVGALVTDRAAQALRRVGWISFWTQLALSIVSAVILFFAIQTGLGPNRTPPLSSYFILVGVVTSFISTFIANTYSRTAQRVLYRGDEVPVKGTIATLVRSINLNLWGMAATIVGLQASVGTLVAKALTSASTNPYVQNPTVRAAAPAALDAFSIQAATNTILAHFASIVFANWLLGVMNKAASQQAA